MRPRLRRLLHPVYRRLETAVHPLRYLFLEVTSRCNLRCLHCGSDCGREAREGELTTDEWRATVDELAARFDPRSLVLVLTGGEPLCRPGLGRILERIQAHGFPWGMVSNGWGLSPRVLDALRARGLASLTVSLDGLAGAHDWLRGARGSFDRAVRAIRAAVAAGPGLPLFDVVTCANPRNLDELPALRALLEAERVPAWRLFTIFPRGRARGNGELLLPPDGTRALLDFVAESRATRAPGGMRVDFSCEGYLPPARDRAVRDEPYFCRAGISIASILCDGAIAVCPNVSRALVQGNVRTDDLADVWERRFGPHRDRSWLRQGACAACGDFPRCQGNSLHLLDDDAAAPAFCTRDLVRLGSGG
jgi:radical SAM protein with 4Fe4S-binding SPASM domain